MNKLAVLVANQIASTIIHEAAHGERWAQQYLPGNLDLQNMNRGEEEGFAEQAEQNAGLDTELNEGVFDDSTISEQLSPDSLLDKAIAIANSHNGFRIPRNAVVNAKLGPEVWGEFEMNQGPDLELDEDTTVAWDHNNRKLLVDVESIINEYNRAVSLSTNNQQQNPSSSQNNNIENTLQEHNVQPSTPEEQQSVPTVQSVQGVPSR